MFIYLAGKPNTGKTQEVISILKKHPHKKIFVIDTTNSFPMPPNENLTIFTSKDFIEEDIYNKITTSDILVIENIESIPLSTHEIQEIIDILKEFYIQNNKLFIYSKTIR